MAIKHVDIIIVGAGLIGSALALSLAKQFADKEGRKTALKIAIVERSPQLSINDTPNQRVVALGKVATSILDDVGVLTELGATFCNSYKRMFVWDESSNGELDFDADEHDLVSLGHMIDSIQCTLLLQRKMDEIASIETYYECEIEGFSRNNTEGSLTAEGSRHTDRFAQLHLSDQVLCAPLIVAADGASSWLRSQAKIFANHRSYQQKGIVARVETQSPHQNTAWQRFLSTGPIGLLPVEKNQSSIVWSADSARAAELMALSDDEFERQLTQALDNKLGHVSLLTQRVAFPLVSQQAESYFARNVVLVGDAAHSIHPLAGQGANLGFKDIQSLVTILTAADVNSLSDVVLLERYQKQRRLDNQQTDLMMSVLHHVYRGEFPIWLTMRGAGMNIVNRSERLKSWLVKQAVGL